MVVEVKLLKVSTTVSVEAASVNAPAESVAILGLSLKTPAESVKLGVEYVTLRLPTE